MLLRCYVRCKLGFKRWRSKVESHRLRGTLRGRGNQERGKRQCRKNRLEEFCKMPQVDLLFYSLWRYPGFRWTAEDIWRQRGQQERVSMAGNG